MDIFDLISEEDLTPDLEILSDLCGIDIVRELLRKTSGMCFYIPKITKLNGFILKYIEDNKFKSRKTLAKELNVSEQYLRQYL